MLTILDQPARTVTVQFSGKHLKEWYAKYGTSSLFICNVIHRVFREQFDIKGHYYPNSLFVINEFRNLFPKRFKKPVAWSETINNNLKSKYNSFYCRKNMIRLIPDDHIFTWVLEKSR